MDRSLRIGQAVAALFVCAALLPLNPLVHWVADPEPLCAYHGDACTCPKKCVREENHNEHEAPALSCHRKQKGDSSSAQSEQAKPGPRLMSCGVQSPDLSVGPDQLYLGTMAANLTHFLLTQPAELLVSEPLRDAASIPPTPPPRA